MSWEIAIVSRVVSSSAAWSGQGSTEAAEWQPDAPHDYSDFASSYHNGLYNWLKARVQLFAPGGLRAVLWHQGESDSTHTAGTTRTTKQDYYDRLKRVITNSQADASWPIPWFVARASEWPLDTPAGDTNIQQAQQLLWTNVRRPLPLAW